MYFVLHTRFDHRFVRAPAHVLTMPTGSPNFVEPTIKLEEKMLQFELQLGQFSGVVCGLVGVNH